MLYSLLSNDSLFEFQFLGNATPNVPFKTLLRMIASFPNKSSDISRSGIGFSSKKKLEIGTYYDTKIQIWTKEVVDAVIEIVRCEEIADGYKYGCEFIGMSDTDALKIDIYQIFNDI